MEMMMRHHDDDASQLNNQLLLSNTNNANYNNYTSSEPSILLQSTLQLPFSQNVLILNFISELILRSVSSSSNDSSKVEQLLQSSSAATTTATNHLHHRILSSSNRVFQPTSLFNSSLLEFNFTTTEHQQQQFNISSGGTHSESNNHSKETFFEPLGKLWHDNNDYNPMNNNNNDYDDVDPFARLGPSSRVLDVESWLVTLIWSLLFYPMVVLAAGGNLLVMWIIATKPLMRTVINRYLLNLTLSDFLSVTFNASFNFVFMINDHWPFGKPYCVVNNFIANLTIASSVCTIMLISLDRYYAIVHPLRRRHGGRRLFLSICIIWFFSALFSVPTLLYSDTIDVTKEDLSRSSSSSSSPQHQHSHQHQNYQQQQLPLNSSDSWLLAFGLILPNNISKKIINPTTTTTTIINDHDHHDDPNNLKQQTFFLHDSHHHHHHYHQREGQQQPQQASRTLCLLRWPDGLSGFSTYEFWYNLAFLVLFYVVPLFTMVIALILMSRVLWPGERIGEHTTLPQHTLIRSKRKVVCMLICVITVFAVCWLPYHTYFLMTYLWPSLITTLGIKHIYLAFYWFAMANSLFNPIILFAMNRRIRNYILYYMKFTCCLFGLHRHRFGRDCRRSSLQIMMQNGGGGGGGDHYHYGVRNHHHPTVRQSINDKDLVMYNRSDCKVPKRNHTYDGNNIIITTSGVCSKEDNSNNNNNNNVVTRNCSNGSYSEYRQYQSSNNNNNANNCQRKFGHHHHNSHPPFYHHHSHSHHRHRSLLSAERSSSSQSTQSACNFTNRRRHAIRLHQPFATVGNSSKLLRYNKEESSILNHSCPPVICGSRGGCTTTAAHCSISSCSACNSQDQSYSSVSHGGDSECSGGPSRLIAQSQSPSPPPTPCLQRNNLWSYANLYGLYAKSRANPIEQQCKNEQQQQQRTRFRFFVWPKRSNSKQSNNNHTSTPISDHLMIPSSAEQQQQKGIIPNVVVQSKSVQVFKRGSSVTSSSKHPTRRALTCMVRTQSHPPPC